MINTFVDDWKTRIERDLTPFADPGVPLEVSVEGKTIHAQWSVRGSNREAQFSVSPTTGVRVQFQGERLTYESFFAHSEMADLLGLAKMILQTHKQLVFVPTRAHDAEETPDGAIPAVELISRHLSSLDLTATQVVMVTGEAGAGKTRVLQELVRRQAEDYCSGRAASLFLYVNAQGRALARFNEALATELQDLRSRVTYHAVATLVRLGQLVPIIDGFDELLGVGGYDDAFDSLAGFIEELDGEGQIVASARSTYYEQEFVARATRTSALGSHVWTQVAVRVLAWSDAEFEEYVKRRGTDAGLADNDRSALLNKLRTIFGGANEELRRRPLFLRIATDLILDGEELAAGDNLRQELVTAYLERERREKLLSREGTPLLTQHQLLSLMSTLAEEMWNLETRELDKRTVRDVAEFVTGTEDIPPDSARVVVERMPTLAFLGRGELSKGVVFEHEVFFAHFLSVVVAARLSEGGVGLRLALGRSPLPQEIAAGSARRYLESKTEMKDVAFAIEGISNAPELGGQRSHQIRENGGRLAASIMVEWCGGTRTITDLTIHSLVFPGVDLGGVTLKNAVLKDLVFRRADLRRCKLIASTATNVEIEEAYLDLGFTRLELEGLDYKTAVRGIRTQDSGGAEVYKPDAVWEALAAVGVKIDELNRPRVANVGTEYVGLVDRLVRAYRRANPLCIDDDGLKSIFRDPYWPSVETALIQAGLVIKEHRATKGKPKAFLRRQVNPEELMMGLDLTTQVPEGVRKFWSLLPPKETQV